MKKIILFWMLIFSFKIAFSQESTIDEIKLQWSKHGKKIHEVFFELNSDIRNYIVAIVADQNYYDLIYISGNLQNWQEGMLKGKIYPMGNNYVVDFNFGNITQPAIEKHNSKFINNTFIISFDDDKDDIYKRIADDNMNLTTAIISPSTSANITRSQSIFLKATHSPSTSPNIIQMTINDAGTFEIPATINDVLI